MNKLRLCLATKDFPFRTGVGTAVYELGQALKSDGHHVVILTSAKGKKERKTNFDGLIVYEVLPKGFPLSWLMSLSIRIPFLEKRFGIEANDIFSLKIGLRFSQVISEIIKTEQVQIMEFPDSFCEGYFSLKDSRIFSSLRIQSPRYLWQHLGVSSTPINPIMKMVEENSFYLANLLLVPSQDMKNNIVKFYKIDPDKLHINPNFVDTDFFPFSSNGTNNDKLSILFANRLEPLKGAQTILEAIPAILNVSQKIEFIFIGESGINPKTKKLYKDDILEKYSKFQNQIKFMPRIPRKELLTYYQNCSVVIAPSLCESLSYNALEGMSCGKPVVASRVGGLCESVIDGVTGYLVPPGDHNAFTEKILLLLENTQLRKDMGMKGREWVEKTFSKKAVLPELIDLYSTMLPPFSFKK